MNVDYRSLDEKVNLTLTKEDLLLFAELVIQKYTERGQANKYPAQMTITQIADYLNYSQAAIYKMVSNSTIPYYQSKSKGKILFKKVEVDSWLSESRQSTITEFYLQQVRRK